MRTVAAEGGAVAVTAPRADSPSWSPDGRQLVVLDQSASLSDGLLNQEVALMDSNGGQRRIVLDLPSSLAAFRVLWSPTGDRLAVLVGPRGTGPSF